MSLPNKLLLNLIEKVNLRVDRILSDDFTNQTFFVAVSAALFQR